MKITESQYLQFIGLLTLSAKANREQDAVAEAAVELLEGASKDQVETMVWEAGRGGPWDALVNPRKALAEIGVEVVDE